MVGVGRAKFEQIRAHGYAQFLPVFNSVNACGSADEHYGSYSSRH